MKLALDWKRRRSDLILDVSQHRDKNIFQGGRRGLDLFDFDACLKQSLARQLLSGTRVFDHDIEVIAESLRVIDAFGFVQKIFRAAQL